MTWQEMGSAEVLKDVECVSRYSTIPGTHALEALHPAWSVPIGIVYYRFAYNGCVDIAYVNVVEQMRHKGIARRMIDELRQSNPGIDFVTQSATALGKGFLEKTGWRSVGPNGHYWIKPGKTK